MYLKTSVKYNWESTAKKSKGKNKIVGTMADCFSILLGPLDQNLMYKHYINC
jgi:hypothetical protein